MSQGSNSQIQFAAGGHLSVSELAGQSIRAAPTHLQKCGVFNNPYFADRRMDTGPVQFGDCTAARPFICTRDFASLESLGMVIMIKRSHLATHFFLRNYWLLLCSFVSNYNKMQPRFLIKILQITGGEKIK